MAMLRLFIAADISDAQRAATIELIDDLRKGIQFTKAHPTWVRPEGLHLTLKFLGNMDENHVAAIRKSVAGRLAGSAAFDCALGGLGVFPNARQPRVLWVGVRRGKRELAALAQKVETALAPLGFEPERRAFHAHLTLARIKALRGAEAMMDVVHGHREAEPGGVARVRHVTLYRSELQPEGAKYTALHHWALEEK